MWTTKELTTSHQGLNDINKEVSSFVDVSVTVRVIGAVLNRTLGINSEKPVTHGTPIRVMTRRGRVKHCRRSAYAARARTRSTEVACCY